MINPQTPLASFLSHLIYLSSITLNIFISLVHIFRFFIEQNNRIFKTFYEVSSREDRTLTAQAVHEMGLDTTGDRLFIAQLVDLYSINVVLPDVVCC